MELKAEIVRFLKIDVSSADITVVLYEEQDISTE